MRTTTLVAIHLASQETRSYRLRLIESTLTGKNTKPTRALKIQNNEFTPFMLAVAIGNIPAMQDLWTTYKGSVFSKGHGIKEALMIAVKYRQHEALKYLLQFLAFHESFANDKKSVLAYAKI